jgi:hypothetical protein
MRTHMTNLIENPPIFGDIPSETSTKRTHSFPQIDETISRAGEGHVEGPHRHHHWHEALAGRHDASLKLDGQHAQGVGHPSLRRGGALHQASQVIS